MSLADRFSSLLRFLGPPTSLQETAAKPATPTEGGLSLDFKDSVWDRTTVRSGEKILPEQLVQWLRDGESGETGKLHAFYDEMRARCPDVEVETGKAESRLAGGRLQFLPWPESLRSRSKEKPTGDAALANEVATYCKDVVLAPDVRSDKAVTSLAQGFWKGIGAVAPRIVPDPIDPRREKIVELKPIPSQRFRWDTQSSRLLLQIGENYDDVVDADALVATGELILLRTEDHVPSPARRGLFRRLLSLAIGLMYGPGWWARFVELNGIPIRVGYHPRGDEAARANLIEGLRSMGAEAFAALPEGAKLEILDAVARSGSSDVHQVYAEFAARTIAKLVNGSSQSTDIQQGSGSKSSASVHEDVADNRHRDRAREVCAVLRSQLVMGLVARRFGWDVAQKHTPEVVLDVDGRPDLLELATAMKTFKEAGAGKAIPLSMVNDRTGIPVPEGDEPTLADTPPALAPGGPGVFPGKAAEEPDEDEGTKPPAPGKPAGKRPPATEEELAARKAGRSTAEELAALERFSDQQAALFGYELIEPVRKIVAEAEAEGWTLEETFTAAMSRMNLPPDSPRLIDALAAVQLEAVMRGITSERDRARVS